MIINISLLMIRLTDSTPLHVTSGGDDLTTQIFSRYRFFPFLYCCILYCFFFFLYFFMFLYFNFRSTQSTSVSFAQCFCLGDLFLSLSR